MIAICGFDYVSFAAHFRKMRGILTLSAMDG
jgi:hypothetical protein